jgi:hypothetical protein
MPPDVEEELDRLYALRPEEFVAARNDLAKRLTKAGERERAAEIKALRKPSLAVWLVNRLARERELDVQRLAKAGEALMQGQAGGPEAREEEQRALARLGEAARQMAESEKVGTASADRATQTLRAAALREDSRELLKRGRLVAEVDPPGLEAFEAFARSAGGKKPKPAQRKALRSGDLREARTRLRALEAEERELASAARAAEREAAQLRTRADRATEARAKAERAVKDLEAG